MEHGNDSRREAAEQLRNFARDEMVDGSLFRTLKAVTGATSWRGCLNVLADLIDWPTCTMVKTDSYKTENGETVTVWECSECGDTCEEVNGAYEFCPHCDAEVVE